MGLAGQFGEAADQRDRLHGDSVQSQRPVAAAGRQTAHPVPVDRNWPHQPGTSHVGIPDFSSFYRVFMDPGSGLHRNLLLFYF